MGFTSTDHRAAAELIAGLIPRFDAAELGAWLDNSGYRPRFNIGPSQAHIVVRARNHRPILAQACWGIPGPNRRLIINARAETVSERPMFRGPFARGRCLVVAHGFYEWDRRGARPQPWWFHDPAERGLLFAGLVAQGPAGVDEFAVITVPANAEVGEIHPRMPAIIDPVEHERWLFGDPLEAKQVLRSARARSLEAIAVSTRVNSLAHDDPACLAPIDAAPPAEQLSLMPN